LRKYYLDNAAKMIGERIRKMSGRLFKAVGFGDHDGGGMERSGKLAGLEQGEKGYR